MKTVKWMGQEYEVVEVIGGYTRGFLRVTAIRRFIDSVEILQITRSNSFITEDYITVNEDTLWQFVRPSKGNFVTTILPDNIRKVVGE